MLDHLWSIIGTIITIIIIIFVFTLNMADS